MAASEHLVQSLHAACSSARSGTSRGYAGTASLIAAVACDHVLDPAHVNKVGADADLFQKPKGYKPVASYEELRRQKS